MLDDFVDFCKEQYPRVAGTLSLYCGNRDIGEELAQEALARACRDWAKVQRADSPEAWVMRVGLNIANSYLRRLTIEIRAKQRLRGFSAHDPAALDVADVVAVRAAVAALPRRPRAAIVLRYYYEFSVRETAEIMDAPEGTVKSLTHRGIKLLSREIAPDSTEGVSDAV